MLLGMVDIKYHMKCLSIQVLFFKEIHCILYLNRLFIVYRLFTSCYRKNCACACILQVLKVEHDFVRHTLKRLRQFQGPFCNESIRRIVQSLQEYCLVIRGHYPEIQTYMLQTKYNVKTYI